MLALIGVAVIATSQAFVPTHTWLQDFLTEIGIAAASGGIVGFVYEHLYGKTCSSKSATNSRTSWTPTLGASV